MDLRSYQCSVPIALSCKYWIKLQAILEHASIDRILSKGLKKESGPGNKVTKEIKQADKDALMLRQSIKP